jgi:hypothetical protein
MSDPAPIPLVAKYAIIRQIILMGVGIALLIPGGCSLVVVALVAAQWLQSGRLDEFVGLAAIVWVFCFAISAMGVVVIRAAWRGAPESAT